MRLIRFAPGSLLFLALCVSAALGQAQRTFVSGSGSDSNPCSRTAPCRTFAQAISQTSPEGEVLVLDSAGYGAFSVNQSISIVSPPGVYAGISVFSGNGIVVVADSSDTVTLRGLSINNQGGANGLDGILSNSVGTLRIESCVVRGFSGSAIDFENGRSLAVKDTVITDCGRGVFTPTGRAATLDHLTVARCSGYAISLRGPSDFPLKATIRDSNLSGNIGGIFVGSGAVLDAERCLIAGNEEGVGAGGGSGVASASLSNCVITRNYDAGYLIIGVGTIYTRGNNTIFGNTTYQGSLTSLPAQ